jgi:hypothetical protein
MARPTTTQLLAALLAAAALLAGAGAAVAATSATVKCTNKAETACSGAAGPLHVTMVPSTHSPVIKAKWPLKVTATLSGKPASASAEYEFLYGSIVVSTQYPRYNKHFRFTGSFSDNLVFPPPSLGQPLTLQLVIKAGSDTVNLDWTIKSVR